MSFRQIIKHVGLITSTNSLRFCSTGVKGAVPTAFDKRLLVYFKRYKTPEDIPKLVSHETLHKVRGKARMYTATIIMVVTLIGCYLNVRSGKRAAERGEYVSRQNLEWHKQIKEGTATK